LSASLASFKQTVEKLIRRFESDRPYHLSKNYSEAQARVDFITPFFKALGWDVENEAGLPHHQREVIVERGESETTGRPDYNFRIGGQTRRSVPASSRPPNWTAWSAKSPPPTARSMNSFMSFTESRRKSGRLSREGCSGAL